jgi:hypothetical protein
MILDFRRAETWLLLFEGAAAWPQRDRPRRASLLGREVVARGKDRADLVPLRPDRVISLNPVEGFPCEVETGDADDNEDGE